MGSDNSDSKRGRRVDRAPLCRALVAVLGIALLIWFTADAPLADDSAVPARRLPRKLIAQDRAVPARKRAAAEAAAAPAEAAAPAQLAATDDADAPRPDDTDADSSADAPAPSARAVAPAAAEEEEEPAPPPAPARAVQRREEALDAPAARGVYRFNPRGIDGETRPLAEFAGQVTLIVNVASACGYTAANYAGLQELHAALAPRGFAVLAFPCDCFGNQEPGSDAEIKAFAEDKYGVTFPLFSKVAAVNGADAHPVFDWLALQNGFEAEVSWNFNKWLIGRNGKPLKRYGPAWDGDAIRADAEDALKVAYEEADAF